jgi:hypothetical protein
MPARANGCQPVPIRSTVVAATVKSVVLTRDPAKRMRTVRIPPPPPEFINRIRRKTLTLLIAQLLLQALCNGRYVRQSGLARFRTRCCRGCGVDPATLRHSLALSKHSAISIQKGASWPDLIRYRPKAFVHFEAVSSRARPSSNLRAESPPKSMSASSPSGRLRCRIPSSAPALRNPQGTCPRWPRMQRGRPLRG